MGVRTMLWRRLGALCAATALAPGHGASDGEAWRAVEQPELKQALEQAPLLQPEKLGEPARGVNTWEYWTVPNPDGKTWDLLQIYFKEYYGPTWLYAVDLGTGKVRKQRLPDKRQFYLSGRALGFDGKYYIATPGPNDQGAWGMFMHVYDPATNTLEDRGEIVPGLSGETRPLAAGPDGRIYGSGSTPGGRIGLYAYDPKSGKVVRNYGPVGPGHPNGAWNRYEMAVDDTHAYLVSGMIPWYLVTVNLETGAWKVLLESPTERVMEIIPSFPGARAIVPGEEGAPQREYWLHHGEVTPKRDDTPPWPKLASPWDGAGPKPELYRGQIDPDSGGMAALWYRRPEDAKAAPGKPAAGARPEDLGWRRISLGRVESYPHRISPLVRLPDSRLFSGGEDYVGSFAFDPKTGRATLLGRNQGIAPYTHLVHEGRLYSSGYPAGPVYVYDPKRPWTVYRGGPPGHPAPDRNDSASNPREIGALGGDTRVAIAHDSALGADGRLYFGGFGERSYTGGGFGWHDPKSGKIGGFWEPLSGYAVFWLAPMEAGRRIVLSTATAPDERNGHRVPKEAKLFVYGVNERKILREIVPAPLARTTGIITEVAPGRLLGLTVTGSEYGKPGTGLLYGVDGTTGEVLFRKALPGPVSTDDYWPHWVDLSYETLDLVRGPDGFVWTYLKDVLVRIDPRNARVHVVGRVDPPGHPTFVGRDLYLSGPETLRRIRNVVPVETMPGRGRTR